jgi:enterochelin esterase family protein
MRTLLVASAVLIAAPAFVFAQKGSVVEQHVKSAALNRDRRVWVYTPPGYAPNDGKTYDFVLAFDGADYQYGKDVPLTAILDSLIGAKRLRPTVALLVDNGDGAERIGDLGNVAKFVTFIGNELVPWFRERYANVSRDASHAIITGSSAGGLAAIHIAWKRPDLFGKVLSQSAALWRGAEASNAAPYEWLTEQMAAAPAVRVKFFIDVGGEETRGALGGAAPSILAAHRRVIAMMRAKHYDVTYTEVPNGVHAPLSWTPRLPVGLVALSGVP